MIKTDVPEQGLVACDVCLKEIPRSAARSVEAADYTYYFCGQQCYEKWLAGVGMREVELTAAEPALDFAAARALADSAAKQQAEDAMLLAWFDRKQGRESPQVPECQHKPGWLAYAESHGGDIKVSINRGEYVFIYASGQP